MRREKVCAWRWSASCSRPRRYSIALRDLVNLGRNFHSFCPVALNFPRSLLRRDHIGEGVFNIRKRTPLHGNRPMQTHAFHFKEIVRCELASSSCSFSASRPRNCSSACTAHALFSYFVSYNYFLLHKTLRFNHFLLHCLQILLALLQNIFRVVQSSHILVTSTFMSISENGSVAVIDVCSDLHFCGWLTCNITFREKPRLCTIFPKLTAIVYNSSILNSQKQ